MGYETVLDDVIDKLEDAVEACTSFSSDSVHFDYLRTEDYGNYDPICLLSLQRDMLEAIGPHLTQHTFTFRVIVKHQGTGVKSDLNDFVKYVGEIVDKIEADRTLGSTYVDVDGSEVLGVEYSQSAQSHYVIYNAYMDLAVRATRNA